MLRIEFKQFVLRAWRRSSGNVMVNCGEMVMLDCAYGFTSTDGVIPAQAGIHSAVANRRPNGFPPTRE